MYALPLNDLVERVNRGRMSLSEAPTSILLSQAVTGSTPEAVKAELEKRKGGSVVREMPQDVQALIDAREARRTWIRRRLRLSIAMTMR